MKNILYRIESAFRCLTMSYMLLFGFKDNFKEAVSITITDKEELDDFAEKLMDALRLKVDKK